jgi:hypothetical protein
MRVHAAAARLCERCAEETIIIDRHENDDRIRVVARCRGCGRQWYGCYAKRLAAQPDQTGNREAWGPVGRWTFSEAAGA